MVDTCAAEFAAETPYYYSVYGSENEVEETRDRKKVLVLGSGPIRIGQGIEFDFCSVHCTWAFAKEGYETIIINNNPETVSTDFDIADKLYFEPLTPEDVESIVDIGEAGRSGGAVWRTDGHQADRSPDEDGRADSGNFGGRCGRGGGPGAVRRDSGEMRDPAGLPAEPYLPRRRPKKWPTVLGYPVLVRPSYVLGGQGMQIAINDHDIDEFIGIINRIAQDHPILVDKYLQGKEIEVDAVCDGEDILIPGIMEHIERAGIHSGDSISVYPAQSITERTKETIAEYTRKLAKSLHVIGTDQYPVHRVRRETCT